MEKREGAESERHRLYPAHPAPPMLACGLPTVSSSLPTDRGITSFLTTRQKRDTGGGEILGSGPCASASGPHPVFSRTASSE
jgi:hypothetical protein